MEDPTPPKGVTVAGFRITRAAKKPRGDFFHVKAAIAVGISLIVLHDGVYRQTQPSGEGDFELWGTISHAGLDMLGLLVFIALTLILVEHGRIR